MHSSWEEGGNEQTAYELLIYPYYYLLFLTCSLLSPNAARCGRVNGEYGGVVCCVVLKFSDLHWVVWDRGYEKQSRPVVLDFFSFFFTFVRKALMLVFSLAGSGIREALPP